MASAGTYSLVFQNQSTNSGSVVIYQTDPNGDPNILSLAWFSKASRPHTNVVFEWKTDYSFVWSETGPLAPGVMFEAGQSWPADLSSSNQVTLTYQGSYSFTNQTRGPQQGSLYIKGDNSLPMNQAAVGIGMSGAGTFVTQARPSWNYTFKPNPQYWIAFGNFQQGQVLDTGAIANASGIQFPAGVSSMTAILTPDNRWTIQRT